MAQLLVETTGSFQLMDPLTKDLVRSTRPSVVRASQFIETRISLGQARIVEGELKDGTTDDDFVAYIEESKGDMELAVSAFISEFGSAQKGQTKKRGGKKAADEGEQDDKGGEE